MTCLKIPRRSKYPSLPLPFSKALCASIASVRVSNSSRTRSGLDRALSPGHDSPLFQKEPLKLLAVHPNAPLPDPDRRQLATLNELVATGPRDVQLRSTLGDGKPALRAGVRDLRLHVDLLRSVASTRILSSRARFR